MGSSIADRPMCPMCKHRMALGRVSPGGRGFEDRTFECSTCERTEKISVVVDPMKDGHRRLARQRTAAAQLTTALVSGWMAVSCVDQDVEVALLVIFAARRRAEIRGFPMRGSVAGPRGPGRGPSRVRSTVSRSDGVYIP